MTNITQKKLYEYSGKEHTLKELLAIANISKTQFYRRLKQGWSIPQIVNNKPVHHGMSDTRLYRIYQGMITRCYNPKYRDKHYQDKGIKVCDEWLNDNKTFFDWALANGYDDKLTIDRIDNNKGYSPENCRWATAYEQTHNRNNSIKVTYKGETKPISTWVKELNLKVSTKIIQTRLTRYGWDVEDAFYTDVHGHQGKEKLVENRLRKWLASHGIYAFGVLKQNKTIDDIGYHQKVFNGGYMTTPGIPDLSITIHSIHIMVECKQETGLLSAQQKHILKQILNSGGYGFVLKPSNYDDVVCFLNAIIEYDDTTRDAMYQVLCSQTYCLINERDRK